MLLRGPRTRQSLSIASVTGDPDIEGGPSGCSPPGGKGRAPELGGKYSLNPSLGARHELVHDVCDRPRTFERSGDRFDRLPDIAQRPAQPLQPFSLLRRQLNQEVCWVGCPVASRAAGRAPRRTASDQPLKGGVGVGSRDAGRSGCSVPSGRPQFEQPRVKAGFGWRETEWSQVDLGSSNSNNY
jgi:hypothetical protein